MFALPLGIAQASECAADCTSALELDPGRVKAYFRRSLAREQLGEDADALRDAKRALEVRLCNCPLVCLFVCLYSPFLFSSSCRII